MDKYILKDGHYIEVFEDKGRFVIFPKDNEIDILKNILKEAKIDMFGNMIDTFINIGIPVNWIKEEFIKDYEFMNKYHPEYLI